MTLLNYHQRNLNVENACLIFLTNIIALIVREKGNIVYLKELSRTVNDFYNTL